MEDTLSQDSGVAPAPALTSSQRRELRARAHTLRPVVQIGSDGLSAGVVGETDRALAAHELVKVRILDEAREDRETMLELLCAATGAQAVQHIGKTLVLWRPRPAEDKPALAPKRVAAPRVPGSRRSAAETPKRRGGSLDTRSRDRQMAGKRRKTPRGGSSQGR